LSSGYREAGYFPEACVNILAFLGWNPGTEQEIFTLPELAAIFSLEKVGKSGSKFDPDKAKWYNHQYLQMKSDEFLTRQFAEILMKKNVKAPDLEKLNKITKLVKERATFVNDLWDHADFFFVRPSVYDPEVVKKRWNNDIAGQMKQLSELLQNCNDFTAHHLESQVKAFIEEKGFGTGQIMNAWRLCLVGTSKGPGLFDISEILGKEEVLLRIHNAVRQLDIKTM
jgi:glutamyl-tRNA synthetase